MVDPRLDSVTIIVTGEECVDSVDVARRVRAVKVWKSSTKLHSLLDHLSGRYL